LIPQIVIGIACDYKIGISRFFQEKKVHKLFTKNGKKKQKWQKWVKKRAIVKFCSQISAKKPFYFFAQ